jgi:hypothetical protein
MPPSLHPPPNASDLRVQGANPGQVAAAGTVILGTFRVPTGFVAVIRQVTFTINGLLVSSVIDFGVRLNGAVPTGWNYRPFGTAAALFAFTSPDSTTIFVPRGGLIEAIVRVTDAGTYDLGADLYGWIYPVAAEDVYRKAYQSVL